MLTTKLHINEMNNKIDLDVIWYGSDFQGMRLAGIIIIGCGFIVIMIPNNWPHFFTTLIRYAEAAVLQQSISSRSYRYTLYRVRLKMTLFSNSSVLNLLNDNKRLIVKPNGSNM